MFRAMDVIKPSDVKRLAQSMTAGKLKKAGIGRLHIRNVFIPVFKKFVTLEGHYVFFVYEKQKTGLFSKAVWRVLIYSLGGEGLLAVPKESVFFEKPAPTATERMLLKIKKLKYQLREENRYDRNHKLFYEKMELIRNFAVTTSQMVCSEDVVFHHLRWTNTDPWCPEKFTIRVEYEPMCWLRYNPVELKAPDGRLFYPDRPPLYGHHIDE
ncbi:MAG: hypothetical protein J5896_02810 [Alphaproteobacteria bacterium]|nr:hypothetical protein [Alphaproteobacteria bacterium]